MHFSFLTTRAPAVVGLPQTPPGLTAPLNPSLTEIHFENPSGTHALPMTSTDGWQSTEPTTEYSWHCTGPYSKLTYNDCMGNLFNTSGCYFKEHFAQYRPCSQECNNVVLGSLDEERCKAYCPGEIAQTHMHKYDV